MCSSETATKQLLHTHLVSSILNKSPVAFGVNFHHGGEVYLATLQRLCLMLLHCNDSLAVVNMNFEYVTYIQLPPSAAKSPDRTSTVADAMNKQPTILMQPIIIMHCIQLHNVNETTERTIQASADSI